MGGKKTRWKGSEGKGSCFICCDLHCKMTGKLPGDTRVVVSTCCRNPLKVHGSRLWPTTGKHNTCKQLFLKCTVIATAQFEDTGVNLVLTGVLNFTFMLAWHRRSFPHSNICSQMEITTVWSVSHLAAVAECLGVKGQTQRSLRGGNEDGRRCNLKEKVTQVQSATFDQFNVPVCSVSRLLLLVVFSVTRLY